MKEVVARPYPWLRSRKCSIPCWELGRESRESIGTHSEMEMNIHIVKKKTHV